MSAAADPADDSVEVLDRQSPRKRRRGAAAREAAARRPADLRRLLDLRVRGGQHRLAGRDHRLRLHPRSEGARLVALHGRRALLQQHPPVGRRAVLLRDGRPPVGQVLDGRLARRPRVACGSPVRSRSWSPSRPLSPATSPSRTSTRSGSPRRPRMRLNSVGVGSFFNLTNFGQMYSYHVLLLPIAVVLLVGVHVLLVRRARRCAAVRARGEARDGAGPSAGCRRRPRRPRRGRRHELLANRGRRPALEGPATRPTTCQRGRSSRSSSSLCWRSLLTVLLSSPDDKPSTIGQWSRELPADFATAAATELDGTSATAEYGPPYNHNSAKAQHFLLPAPAEMARRQPPDQHGRRLRDRTAGNGAQRRRAAERARRIQGRARKDRKRNGLKPTPSRLKNMRRRWKKRSRCRRR